MKKVLKLVDRELTINKRQYTITGTFTVCVDHYGADADGNRGVRHEHIESFNIKRLELTNISGNYDIMEEILQYLDENMEKFE